VLIQLNDNDSDLNDDVVIIPRFEQPQGGFNPPHYLSLLIPFEEDVTHYNQHLTSLHMVIYYLFTYK
jgi:hypothetical protein